LSPNFNFSSEVLSEIIDSITTLDLFFMLVSL
jgi:hypothetical protein